MPIQKPQKPGFSLVKAVGDRAIGGHGIAVSSYLFTTHPTKDDFGEGIDSEIRFLRLAKVSQHFFDL